MTGDKKHPGGSLNFQTIPKMKIDAQHRSQKLEFKQGIKGSRQRRYRGTISFGGMEGISNTFKRLFNRDL